MAILTFNQQVRYFPGTVPCAGATVTVYDVDAGGNGDDVIYTGTTDSQGFFRGQSREWVDSNTARVPTGFGGFITQNVPDVLVLQVRVRKGNQDSGRMPYAVTPVGVPAPPIILPFGSPQSTLHVDGDLCNSTGDFFGKVMDKLANGQDLKIAIRGPESEIFDRLANVSPNDLLDYLDGLFPGIKVALNQSSNLADPVTIVAITGLVLACGAVTVGMIIAASVGTALILALLLGYCNVRFSQVPGNADNPLPGHEFTVEKCC